MRFVNKSDLVNTQLKYGSRYILESGLTNIFWKGPDSKYFWLCWPSSLCTQLCHYSSRAATGNMQMKEHSCVPTKFNLQKQAVGWMWPPGCTGLLGSGCHGLQPRPVPQWWRDYPNKLTENLSKSFSYNNTSHVLCIYQVLGTVSGVSS